MKPRTGRIPRPYYFVVTRRCKRPIELQDGTVVGMASTRKAAKSIAYSINTPTEIYKVNLYITGVEKVKEL